MNKNNKTFTDNKVGWLCSKILILLNNKDKDIL